MITESLLWFSQIYVLIPHGLSLNGELCNWTRKFAPMQIESEGLLCYSMYFYLLRTKQYFRSSTSTWWNDANSKLSLATEMSHSEHVNSVKSMYLSYDFC